LTLKYQRTTPAIVCTAQNQSSKTGAGVTLIAGSYMSMNTEKIKNTLDEFVRRDEDRVKDMQQSVIEAGGDLGPDMVLMVLVDRLKDLSTLVAVMAKEMINNVQEKNDE
jgi:hypothetical protein